MSQMFNLSSVHAPIYRVRSKKKKNSTGNLIERYPGIEAFFFVLFSFFNVDSDPRARAQKDSTTLTAFRSSPRDSRQLASAFVPSSFRRLIRTSGYETAEKSWN